MENRPPQARVTHPDYLGSASPPSGKAAHRDPTELIKSRRLGVRRLARPCLLSRDRPIRAGIPGPTAGLPDRLSAPARTDG